MIRGPDRLLEGCLVSAKCPSEIATVKKSISVFSADPAADGPSDFRVRVARQKRERMRSRLLAATMEVCSVQTSQSPAVIEDVI